MTYSGNDRYKEHVISNLLTSGIVHDCKIDKFVVIVRLTDPRDEAHLLLFVRHLLGYEAKYRQNG